MGQIQSQINNLFNTTLASVLAYQHSPAYKYKRARGEAVAKREEAYSTLATILETPPNDEEYGNIQKLPGRENLEQKKELLNYAEAIQTADKEWKQSIEAVRDVDMMYGSKSTRRKIIQERGEERHEELSEGIYGKPTPEQEALRNLQWAYRHRQGQDTWEKDTVRSIQKAYDAKRGVKNSVLERYQAWLESGETVPETPSRDSETESTILKNPGSRLYKG